MDNIQDRRLGMIRGRARRRDRLTPREVQIVNLIADGASNSAIGARLVLSVRTVERHIENIYSKLGVQGRTARAAVAAYAVRTESTAFRRGTRLRTPDGRGHGSYARQNLRVYADGTQFSLR
jgi:DNA-binding CsgD family transcriptional regulator